MRNNCEYCSTSFRGERRTKKYCSDNCRQMAYLTRKGYLPKESLNSVKDTISVNTVKPIVKDIFYSTTVKDVNDVNDTKEVKDSVKSIQPQAEEPLEGFRAVKLMRRMESLEKTIEQQNHLLLTM